MEFWRCRFGSAAAIHEVMTQLIHTLALVICILLLHRCAGDDDDYDDGDDDRTDMDDHFSANLCRERNYRMDWRRIRKPCEGKMNFSSYIYSKKRTNANISLIVGKQIRRAGEYSSFVIKTFDLKGRPKTIGGDTWRVFIKGKSYLESNVYDRLDGSYEAAFLLLDPGEYNVTAYLQGSMCSSFVNPPFDWFEKGDYNGHFQNEWQYKDKKKWPFLMKEHMWSELKTFTFVIQENSLERKAKNMARLRDWTRNCNRKGCNFLFDGFGRWSDDVWKADINKTVSKFFGKDAKVRKKKGTLWFYGDCYAYHLYQNVWNTSLCHEQFKDCGATYNWVYPRWNPDNKKDKSLHMKTRFKINIPWLVKYFKGVLKKPQLKKKDSGMLLNLGLHFIRSTSFENYQKIIKRYIKQIKKHKTRVIWRTTTSIYIPEFKAHKRFQTYQRAMLFNAFSMSEMCRAGIPIVDVFPMTAGYPHQPEDGIHFDLKLLKPVIEVLKSYFHYL